MHLQSSMMARRMVPTTHTEAWPGLIKQASPAHPGEHGANDVTDSVTDSVTFFYQAREDMSSQASPPCACSRPTQDGSVIISLCIPDCCQGEVGFRTIHSPKSVGTAVPGPHDPLQCTSPSLSCDNPFNILANVLTGYLFPMCLRRQGV